MADRDSTTDPHTARKRPWLRRVRVVVGCLLAGAIINVLVAWGCAAVVFNQIYLWPDHFEGSSEEDSLFRSYVSIQWDGSYETKLANVTGVTCEYAGLNHFGEKWYPPYRVIRIKAGLPLRTFQGTRVQLFVAQSEYVGENIITDDCYGCFPASRPDALFPYRPIGVGLIVNTLAYSAPILGLLMLARRFRSSRRSRASRCPSCKYDLRGADHGKCPECGEAVVKA